MKMIWYIVIFIVVLGVLSTLYETIVDLVGNTTAKVMIILSIVTLIAFSWKEVVAVVVGCIGVSVVGKYVKNIIEDHDKSAQETAKIKQKTQKDKEMQTNESKLINELNENCKRLGYMSEDMWETKLPNYVNRKYETSFTTITTNYAVQMEQQNITQNDEWMKPFIDYILSNQQGSTAVKMLNEISCPQLEITHATPDIELLTMRLEEGTKRVSKDVPPLFHKTQTDAGTLYTPSKYLLRLHGKIEKETESAEEEINFDDL